MHESGQNQIFSKCHGLPAKIEDLPLKCDRVIKYKEYDQNIPCEKKDGSDLLDFMVDMSQWLGKNETIVDVFGWTCAPSLTLSAIQFSGIAVKAWLYGGVDKERHTVGLNIRTDQGRAKQVYFSLHIERDAIPMAIVTAQNNIAFCSDITGMQPSETGAKLEVDNKHLTFRTSLGTDQTQTLTVTNNGTMKGYIRDIKILGDAFTQKNNGMFTLDVDESIDIQIKFTPMDYGVFTGSIEIDVGDFYKQITTLNGTGLA